MDRKNPLPPTIISRIGHLHIRIRKECGKLFREENFPLEMDQIPVLMLIYYDQTVTQQEICSKLERDKASVNRTIAFLMHREIVTVRPDDTDKRKTRVELTPAGKKLAKRADTVLEAFSSRLSAAFSDAEMKQFEHLMSKLTNSIALPTNIFTLL